MRRHQVRKLATFQTLVANGYRCSEIGAKLKVSAITLSALASHFQSRGRAESCHPVSPSPCLPESFHFPSQEQQHKTASSIVASNERRSQPFLVLCANVKGNVPLQSVPCSFSPTVPQTRKKKVKVSRLCLQRL